MGFDSEESEATELLLYLDNEEPLYRQKKAIAANLAKKFAKGTYDSVKAPQAWSYVVEAAAKRYHKEFPGGGKWSDMWPAKIRRIVAVALAERYHANMKAGHFDDV